MINRLQSSFADVKVSCQIHLLDEIQVLQFFEGHDEVKLADAVEVSQGLRSDAMILEDGISLKGVVYARVTSADHVLL